MEKKNNSLVIILMGVIIVILAVLCVLFATDTISFNSKESNNSENNEIIDESNLNNQDTQNNTTDNTSENLDTDSILEKLNGVWGYKKAEYSNYIITVNKDNKTYGQALYGTDGGQGGTVLNAKQISDNKFEIEVFSKGCKGTNCMDEKDDETLTFVIELNKEKNIIISNNNEYQFITENTEDYNTIDSFFYK